LNGSERPRPIARKRVVMSDLNETKDCFVVCPSKEKKIKKEA
jgi:hypothetical protein